MGRAAVRIEGDVLIPPDVGDFEAFRRWTVSDEFPEAGRIDYLEGTIEVEMCPEELQSHGALKAELLAYVHGVVKARNLGQVFVDRARLSASEAGLSCEPDILFVSLEALRSGRVRYVPSRDPRRLIEVEGAATLAVEVVSDSSVEKDTHRLPPLYGRAGVEELWLVDARGPELSFRIHHLVDGAYRAAPVDGEGFQDSKVLGLRIRLRRESWEIPGTWQYFVDED